MKTRSNQGLLGALFIGVGCGLAAVGILIIVSGAARPREGNPKDVDARAVAAMGFMQGLSLVFRGFSRSGSTISAGLLAGSGKNQTEEFSFALGLMVTPFVIARETMRLASRHGANGQPQDLFHLAIPGLMGMGCSFIGAMAALIILSRWLVKGKWRYFGFYCLAASAAVFVLAARGL